MNPEPNHQVVETSKTPHSVNQITPVSKYFALVLFILLPFVGGYIGYQLSEEKHEQKSVIVPRGEEEVLGRYIMKQYTLEEWSNVDQAELAKESFGIEQKILLDQIVVLTGVVDIEGKGERQIGSTFVVILDEDSVSRLPPVIQEWFKNYRYVWLPFNESMYPHGSKVSLTVDAFIGRGTPREPSVSLIDINNVD